MSRRGPGGSLRTTDSAVTTLKVPWVSAVTIPPLVNKEGFVLDSFTVKRRRIS